MPSFELRPSTSAATQPDSEQLIWAVGDDEGTLRCDDDPWLTDIGNVSTAAVDLVRIGVGAYAADRLTPRPRTTFGRTFDLHVHITDPQPWLAEPMAITRTQRLLERLTGDEWGVHLHEEAAVRPSEPGRLFERYADRVALLSGGLDSLCGTVLAPRSQRRLHLGHWDNPSVKHAQNQVRDLLVASLGTGFSYRQPRLAQKGKKREGSTRSRSLLFLSLAAALADSSGAPIIEVPENGPTSINHPLAPGRGGALSTRSTHPLTLALAEELFRSLGLEVTIANPYQSWTKGDMVRAAAERWPDTFEEVAACSLSCSKLDGRVYQGGNANLNCGVCYPCAIRRGAFAAAGVCDRTQYLCDLLDDYQAQRLAWRRRTDIHDVRHAVARTISGDDLLGPFPSGFNREDSAALCMRSLAEMARVRLPTPSKPQDAPAEDDAPDELEYDSDDDADVAPNEASTEVGVPLFDSA